MYRTACRHVSNRMCGQTHLRHCARFAGVHYVSKEGRTLVHGMHSVLFHSAHRRVYASNGAVVNDPQFSSTLHQSKPLCQKYFIGSALSSGHMYRTATSSWVFSQVFLTRSSSFLSFFNCAKLSYSNHAPFVSAHSQKTEVS